MNNRRFVALLIAAGTLIGPAAVLAAGPTPETLDGWNTVVSLMDRRLACVAPCDVPHIDERAVLGGKVDVTRMTVTDDSGREVHVHDATIQYWRGAVFIPQVTLARLLDVLMAEPPRQPDVLAARILSRDGDRLSVRLRVVRRTLLTVVYDTEHDMLFHRESSRIATSRSVMTRAVEIMDAGSASEHVRPAADDRGFLWRLNSYWWYEERPNGVLAVLDSLTLSRDVPAVLRPVAGPVIHRVAVESVTAALEGLRDRDYRSSR